MARKGAPPRTGRPAQRPGRRQGPSRTAVAIVVVVALVAAGVLVVLNSRPAIAPTVGPPVAGEGMSKGPADAKVKIVEYSDFQCPYCARFAESTGKQIDQQYVSTGKARFTYRNFAFIGQESTWAAEASECAAEQGKFWEYHDKLFASQAGENKGAFSKDNLKKFAIQLGLDSSKFDSCLDSGKYKSQVETETAEGKAAGVKSTPTFFIDGREVEGSQPFSVFQRIIDEELSKGK